MAKEDIQYWLTKFVVEAKQKDGNEYPPNTIYQICYGRRRALNSAGHTDVNIFNAAEFSKFRDTLDF